jgi:integrase
MPRVAKELSTLEVKRLKHSGRNGLPELISVGGVAGLLIQVTPNGSKSWLLRTTIAGRRRKMGLGSYPTVSLAQARERAREATDAIWHGKDPVEERRAEAADLVATEARNLSFADAVDKFLEAKLAEFKNEKHRKQWRSTLVTYACPVVGMQPVSTIDVHDIRRVLQPIWQTKTETASRLRGRIESVLAWATVAGHRDGDNPARWRGNLDAVLPKPAKVATRGHWPALALKDAPDWFGDVVARKGAATRALEFLALTAARSGEIRGATWSEVDLAERLWTLPADRMKAGKMHRVPLTDRAVALLRDLPRFEETEFVFPAPRGGQLSDMALQAVMRRVHGGREQGGYVDALSGRPAVVHGLRSTFRDWAVERTEYPSDMAEIALAHTVGSEVERAYRRSDMIEKRREMMADWEDFLCRKN